MASGFGQIADLGIAILIFMQRALNLGLNVLALFLYLIFLYYFSMVGLSLFLHYFNSTWVSIKTPLIFLSTLASLIILSYPSLSEAVPAILGKRNRMVKNQSALKTLAGITIIFFFDALLFYFVDLKSLDGGTVSAFGENELVGSLPYQEAKNIFTIPFIVFIILESILAYYKPLTWGDLRKRGIIK